MICEKNVNDWEYNQFVQLIKVKYEASAGISGSLQTAAC